MANIFGKKHDMDNRAGGVRKENILAGNAPQTGERWRWVAPSGWDMGCPLPGWLEGLGDRRDSWALPSRGHGVAPTGNAFCRILKATERFFWICSLCKFDYILLLLCTIITHRRFNVKMRLDCRVWNAAVYYRQNSHHSSNSVQQLV